MIDDSRFFIPENRIDSIPEEEYLLVKSIIDDMDAVARITYKNICVVDYYRHNFLYVSENHSSLCGMKSDDIKELGYKFYINQTTKEDLELLTEITLAGFRFFEKITKKERNDYTISYDFHVINAQNQKKTLINHQLTPLRLTGDGKIWLALCAASLSSNNSSGNVEIFKRNSSTYWIYNRKSKRWIERQMIKLKDYERDVLRLSAQGATMNDIAEDINRSTDSVKQYRKAIFRKLGTDNISAAINFAINHKLL